jgi:hypothetical protein
VFCFGGECDEKMYRSVLPAAHLQDPLTCHPIPLSTLFLMECSAPETTRSTCGTMTLVSCVGAMLARGRKGWHQMGIHQFWLFYKRTNLRPGLVLNNCGNLPLIYPRLDTFRDVTRFGYHAFHKPQPIRNQTWDHSLPNSWNIFYPWSMRKKVNRRIEFVLPPSWPFIRDMTVPWQEYYRR